MKTFKSLFAAAAILLAALPFASCGSDDDDVAPATEQVASENTFQTPQYESHAKKYVMKSSTEFESIELTASGNYIITTKDSTDYGYVRVEVAPFLFEESDSRTGNIVYGNVMYGKYTINADGSYNLDGFGTIAIANDAEGDATLSLTRNGKTETLHASVLEQKLTGAMADKVCRTWRIAGYGLKLTYNGQVYEVEGKTLEEFAAKYYEVFQEKYRIPNDVPENVIFSKSGTYCVTYINSKMGISYWKWKNEATGSFYYAWDNNFSSTSGDAKFQFDGKKLYVLESKSDIDKEELTMVSYTILEEA